MRMNKQVDEIAQKVKETLPVESIEEGDQQKDIIVFEKTKSKMEYMYLSAVSEMDYVYFDRLIRSEFWNDQSSLKDMIKERDKSRNGGYYNILKGQLMTRSIK